MTRVLVIGFGSDLRGDDALGPRVAEMLLQRRLGDGVRVLARPSLTPELAHDAAAADLVIFIDCDAQADPGRITRRDLAAAPAADAAAMVHFLNAPALLAWTRTLYGATPRAVMFTVGGAAFDCADDLSAPVAGAVPQLLDRITAEIQAANPAPSRCCDAALR